MNAESVKFAFFGGVLFAFVIKAPPFFFESNEMLKFNLNTDLFNDLQKTMSSLT